MKAAKNTEHPQRFCIEQTRIGGGAATVLFFISRRTDCLRRKLASWRPSLPGAAPVQSKARGGSSR